MHCTHQGSLPALATGSSTLRAGVSAEPPTGGRSFAMSTRATAGIRRRAALQIHTGHMRRVTVTKPTALSVMVLEGISASFPSSGTGGSSPTAPPTSRRMALRGARLVSGEKVGRQYVGVLRTVQLPAIMAPVRTTNTQFTTSMKQDTSNAT